MLVRRPQGGKSTYNPKRVNEVMYTNKPQNCTINSMPSNDPEEFERLTVPGKIALNFKRCVDIPRREGGESN